MFGILPLLDPRMADALQFGFHLYGLTSVYREEKETGIQASWIWPGRTLNRPPPFHPDGPVKSLKSLLNSCSRPRLSVLPLDISPAVKDGWHLHGSD